MNKVYFSLLLTSCGIFAQQPGGRSTFAFLNVPINARVAGLGGELVSQYGDDPNTVRYNPAAANSQMHQTLGLNYMKYYGDIYVANSSFVYGKDSLGIVWAGNLSYLEYGKMDRYDDGGNPTGTFSAREYAAVASAAKRINYFSLGVNLGLAGSNLGGYNAHGVFMDLGGMYVPTNKGYTIGLLIKNIGFNFNNYTKKNFESMPIDIQTGVTIKPQHMPLRFNITLHKLYRYNVSYYDPVSKIYIDQQGDVNNRKPGFLDKTIRHVNIGVEAILGKGFNLRAGYSFMRRQDLRFQAGSSGWAGFSAGAMIRIKRLSFEYTQIFHHAAGSKGIITLNIKI
ncbi:MAG TPA: type IX secretion system protein PorQ [Cytophagales bacterium]|nr:type IX secretion system protein PorQ [Cytophagales bacterium]